MFGNQRARTQGTRELVEEKFPSMIAARHGTAGPLVERNCLLCGSDKVEQVGTVKQKPSRETDFNISPHRYRREILKCLQCGVYTNWHQYDFKGLYRGVYNAATYNNEIGSKYENIMALPLEQSDNKQRVERICRFLSAADYDLKGLRVLDVGSGLCVFLGELLKYGVDATCLDPDPISVAHAQNTVGVKRAVVGKFEAFIPDEKYDLITFNKVLEHVLDPISILKKAEKMITPRGIVYVELPDGESALRNGEFSDREEFFIEHYTIFDRRSMSYLLVQAGLDCLELKDIHEPSDKYTLYSFAKVSPRSQVQ